MAARLPSHLRLKTAAQYKRTLSTGQRIQCAPLTLVYACGQGGTGPRLGLALSSRQLPRAVDRNRIKRLVRESFRLRPGIPAVDVVFMASRQAAECSSARLRAVLDTLWQQLTARCAPSSTS